jgi:hypothetical protein
MVIFIMVGLFVEGYCFEEDFIRGSGKKQFGK